MATKWTEETIKDTLLKLKQQLGRFPNGKDLIDLGYSGLKSTLYRAGFTLDDFKEANDKKLTKWDEDLIIIELSNIALEIGEFPTLTYLRKIKRTDLEKAIAKRGGFRYFQKIMGFEHKEREKGFWNNKENLKNIIYENFGEMIDKGIFPTKAILINTIGGRIGNALANCGGIAKIAQEMNCEPNFFIATDGHFLDSGNEYILDEYLYARGIEHSVGEKISPDFNYRYDFKINDYYVEIWGYENNRDNKRCDLYNQKREKKEQLYKDLNLKLISIEGSLFQNKPETIEQKLDEIFSSYGFDISLKTVDYDISNSIKNCRYWNEERIIEEAKKIVEIYGELPSRPKLIELGYGGMADAINRAMGFYELKKKLGLDKTKYPNNYWNESEIINQLLSIIEELKYFPTFDELKNMGKYDLLRAMNRHGRVNYYREKLGYKIVRQTNGIYTEEFIIKELVEIKNKIEHFPSWTEIKKINKKLYCAINNGMNKKKWSGITYFKDKINNI